MNNKEHLDYIDALKGFAMFLVVMAHAIAWSFNTYGRSFHVEAADTHPAVLLWWNVIYSFHMPLLFFISGYLFVVAHKDLRLGEVPRFVWRKFYTLLLPYFTVGVAFWVLTGNDITQYWFLITLFVFILASLPYEVVRSYYKRGGV